MKYSLTFHLRDRKATTPQPIYAYIQWQNRQIKIVTGERIAPKHWNQDKGRVRKGATGEVAINRALAKMETDIGATFARIELEAIEPLVETVRARYATISGRETKQPEPPADDLLERYERFIKTNGYTVGANRNHRMTLNHIRTFGQIQGAAVTFDGINEGAFWPAFKSYLLSEQKLTTESCWNVVKCLRAFAAVVRPDIAKGEGFAMGTKAKLLPKAENSTKPYLTTEELDRLQALDLTNSTRLERVRDLFVFACYTGLRYSDTQEITPENLDGKTLRLTTGKNRKSITVPLLEVAIQILHKYDGTLPRISNQKGNVYLSEVLDLAGINQPCKVVSYSGTERREAVLPKSKLIGFHGGKRTFATILRQRGVSIETICLITGNNRATIESYFVGTSEDAEREFRAAMG